MALPPTSEVSVQVLTPSDFLPAGREGTESDDINHGPAEATQGEHGSYFYLHSLVHY